MDHYEPVVHIPDCEEGQLRSSHDCDIRNFHKKKKMWKIKEKETKRSNGRRVKQQLKWKKSWWPVEKKKCGRWKSEVQTTHAKFGWWIHKKKKMWKIKEKETKRSNGRRVQQQLKWKKSWWTVEKKKCGRWKSEVQTTHAKFGWWIHCPPNTRSEGILSKYSQSSLASINPMCLSIKCRYPHSLPLEIVAYTYKYGMRHHGSS